MSEVELRDRVAALRGEGKSPKQIARILGVAPSVVAPLVRAAAAQARAAAGEPALVGCWINAGWSRGLTVDPARGWVDAALAGGDASGGSDILAGGDASDDGDGAEDVVEPIVLDARNSLGGLVTVLVARAHRWGSVSVCGYLADVYCLGVKNAMGPDVMMDVELPGFREQYFAAQSNGWQDAPLGLAADLVFGSVEYARGLGFEPHPDLAAAAGHLGSWAGPSAITFGKDGRPFYVSGPYDDPRRVMRTLQSASTDAQPGFVLGPAG
ncbi:helix-turn-helix domain-containing protein [Frankia sp. R82]|uniref:helix-turn-helix domain-containing protein n=1 Tax=Frankia sp. R82 TaxID=2950553 RepID=UPI002042ED81|nr:helix-turn-helix domain-containing protein [Frankia sp. R82]MCM3882901.1 helix-turn-helix domain-containing protein [Frankia sp. R82]